MYKGYEGAVSTIKEVFNRARENRPSIVLLDELDAIASKRWGANELSADNDNPFYIPRDNNVHTYGTV